MSAPRPATPRCIGTADLVRQNPEDVREVIRDLRARGDALSVFREDEARRVEEERQAASKGVVERLRTKIVKGGKQEQPGGAAAAGGLSADQQEAIAARQRQQQAGVVHGAVPKNSDGTWQAP